MSKVKDTTENQQPNALVEQLTKQGSVCITANSRDEIDAKFQELLKASPAGVTLAAGAVGRSRVGGIYTLQVNIV